VYATSVKCCKYFFLYSQSFEVVIKDIRNRFSMVFNNLEILRIESILFRVRGRNSLPVVGSKEVQFLGTAPE
jgi:hypothetical protein